MVSGTDNIQLIYCMWPGICRPLSIKSSFYSRLNCLDTLSSLSPGLPSNVVYYGFYEMKGFDLDTGGGILRPPF